MGKYWLKCKSIAIQTLSMNQHSVNSRKHFRFPNPLKTPALTAAFLAVGTVLSTIAGFGWGNPWLMPILGAAVSYPILLFYVQRDRHRSAIGWMLFWALCQSVAVAVATTFAPEKAAQVVLSGTSSTAEMLHWIRTGTGAEGSLRLFLPTHLRSYLVFCILSLITCGSGALILGTYQLNYMNFYVAQLIQLSVNPWLSGAIAWPIWSMLRVIGYLYTGVALTVGGLNLISLLKKQVPTHQFPQRFLLLGFGFVVGDIVVKAALAPIWQKLLLKGLLG